MTKKLQDEFGLTDMYDLENNKLVHTQEEVVEIQAQLTSAEKIDFALTNITGLDEHDREMDDIAAKALNAYQSIFNLGMSCTEMNAGKVLDSAAHILKVALDAKDAKVAKKLKMIDLMIKKHRIEKENEPETDPTKDDSAGFDRNDLIRLIRGNTVDIKPTGNGK